MGSANEAPDSDEGLGAQNLRRTLEEALDSLRHLRSAQQEAERLIRQALHAVPRTAEADPEYHESPLLSVSEAAEILGITPTQAWEMVKHRTITSFRLGQRVVVPRASLEGWEETMGSQGLG